MKIYGTKWLETGRLILRRFEAEDAGALFENCTSDEQVWRFFAFGPDRDAEETRRTLEDWLKGYETEYYYRWAVVEKESHEVIGWITADDPYPELRICEVAYGIGSKWWGGGYTTEALREVLRFLLTEEGMYLVEAKYNRRNAASGKVMAKAGMTVDGVLRGRRIDKLTGEREDLIVCSVTAAQWEEAARKRTIDGKPAE